MKERCVTKTCLHDMCTDKHGKKNCRKSVKFSENDKSNFY